MSAYGRPYRGDAEDWIRIRARYMTNERKVDSDTNESEPRDTRKPAIAGLAIAIVLLVVGWWLARELTAASKMQVCLMSGRTICNQIQPQ